MASTGLRRTLSGNGNQYTATFSVWVKRASTANDARIYTSWYDGNNQGWITFTNNTVGFFIYQSSSYSVQVRTNRVFRDTSAWYHVLFAIDTTQGTAADRVKIYINGVQETSMAQTDYPNQNQSLPFGLSSYNQRIGERSGDDYFDGCMSHFHFVDGTAYTPSTFGETDATTGEWKIKSAPGLSQANYGTNGFFILKDGNSVTDQSGNSNNWTVNSGSLTNTEDCPDNNFATLNPLQTNLTLTNGATAATTTNYKYAVSTMAVNSGKYYFEMKVTHACMIIGIQDMIKANDGIRNTAIFWSNGSQSYHLDGFSRFTHDSYGDISTSSTDYPTYTNGDIVMMALDLDNNKLAYGKNGTWYNSTNPSSGTTNMVSIDAPSTLDSGYYGIVAADTCGASDGTFYVNFGNGYFGTTAISSEGTNASGIGKFEYDVPTGYTALSTKGLNE
jgi:hypothetical protein